MTSRQIKRIRCPLQRALQWRVKSAPKGQIRFRDRERRLGVAALLKQLAEAK